MGNAKLSKPGFSNVCQWNAKKRPNNNATTDDVDDTNFIK